MERPYHNSRRGEFQPCLSRRALTVLESCLGVPGVSPVLHGWFLRVDDQFVKSCLRYSSEVFLVFCIGWTQANGTGTGRVSGRVQDPTGKALAGVKVTLSDDSDRVVATTTTSSAGEYRFDAVKAGRYRLKADRRDFNPSSPANIDLTLQQNAWVNLVLQPHRRPAAEHHRETPPPQQKGDTVGYYQSSSLRADEVLGGVDAAGYSAPANADTTARLLNGTTALRLDAAARLEARLDKASEESGHSEGLHEAELRDKLERSPESFEANHDLGELYLREGKADSAVPYLAKAYRLSPADSSNAYDLALGYLRIGNLSAAREQLQAMIERSDAADVHSLLAEVEDQSGNFTEATQEYQRAAQLAPSEQNIFDWGSELVSHHAVEPGVEVFKHGVGRYPKSPEMWIGLGVALYLQGDDDQAVQSLLRATDLDPADDRPYAFLADTYNVSPKEAGEVTKRLKCFADLHPQNARVVYYYALSLWKGTRGGGPPADLRQVEALLRKSCALDPGFSEAHLQLGILYASQEKYREAVEQYRQAIELDAGLAEAHYRLGQALARCGRREEADQEFKVSERLHQQRPPATEKGRGKIQQLINLANEGKRSTP